jgi:hypothetical protein
LRSFFEMLVITFFNRLDLIRSQSHFFAYLSIPVNVTADSGNMTSIPVNVTEDLCCAF